MRHAAVGLMPDFRAGGFEMGERIRLIIILIGLEVAIGILVEQLAAEDDRAVRAFERVRIDRLGAERRDNALALGADVRGHHQLDRIADRRADHRERDSSIAGSRIEDDFAGAQFAAREAKLDHFARGAILHRAAGVETLELGEDAHARPQQSARQTRNLEQRRIADQLEHAAGARWRNDFRCRRQSRERWRYRRHP